MSNSENNYGRESVKKHLDDESYDEENDEAETKPIPRPRKRTPALISQGMPRKEALMDHRERTKEHKSESETEEENEPQLERKEVDSRVKTDSRKFHMERSKNEALMDHRERAKEHKSESETEEENEPQLERKEVDSRVKTDSRKFHMERSINEDYPGDDERHVGIGEKKPSTARRPQSSGYLSNSDESYHGSSKNKLRDRRIGQRSFDESNSRSGKGNKLPSSSENESDSDNTTLRAVRRPGDKAYVKEDDVQRSTKNTFSMREGNSDSDYRHFSEEKDKESDKRTVQHVDHDGEKEYNVSRESRHKEKMLQGRQISIEKSNRIEYDSGESIVEEKRSYHFKSSTKKNNNRSESSEDEQYKRNAPVRSEVNRDSNRRKANTLNLRNNESDSESDDSLPRRNKKNDSDSDRYHLKETKYRDEERNYSSRKSSGKFVVEGKIRYKESKEEQLSESNDTGSFKTGKSKFNEDQYEEHAPRRRKDMTSKKSPKYRSDSFELLHSKHDPLQKSKYQLSSDEGESYARRFHNQMVDIDANSRQRKEIESPSHHYKEEPCEDKNIMEGHLSTDFKGKLHINRGDRYHKELVDSDVNYGRGKKSLSTEERNSDWNRKKMGDYSSRNIQEKYYSNKEDRYQEMADTDVYYGRRKKELQSNEYEEEKPDCRSRNLQNNYVDREDRDQEEMMDIDQSSSRMKKMESSFGHFKELNDKDRNRRSSIEPGYEYEMYGSGRRRQHRSSEKERNTVSEWTKGDNYREPYSSGEQFIEHDFDRSMQHFDENQGYGYNLSSDIQRKVPEIDWENQKASHARKRDDEPPLEYLESYGKNSNPKANRKKMAERLFRHQHRRYRLSESDSDSDDFRYSSRRNWDRYSSDEQDYQGRNFPRKPNPGQPDFVMHKRDNPRNPNVRRQPSRDFEERGGEGEALRTPRNQGMGMNAPNPGRHDFYQHRRRGQNIPNFNQGPPRNYRLWNRQPRPPSPVDSSRPGNFNCNEALGFDKQPHSKHRMRGPPSLSELNMTDGDQFGQPFHSRDLHSEEDDSEDEDIRWQQQGFRGRSRQHPDHYSKPQNMWSNVRDRLPNSENADEFRERRETSYGRPLPGDSQRIHLSPEELLGVLSKKRHLRATLLHLLENHHMDFKLVPQVVKANPHLFQLIGEEVELKIDVKICDAHNGTKGCLNRATCRNLHICLDYVKDKCDNVNCVMGHNWFTRHNKGILEALKLQNISESTLERLLQLSLSGSGASSSGPRVCNKYNKGECQYQQCSQLHICYTFVTNHLKCSNKKCKLNHDLLSRDCCRVLEAADIDVNESPRDVLVALLEANPSLKKLKSEVAKKQPDQDQGKEIKNVNDQEQGNNIKSSDAKIKIERKKKNRTYWSTQAFGDVPIAEICYDSVEGSCSNEASGCQRLHALEHYHWQMSESGSSWLNLQRHQVKALERAYCDVSRDGAEMPRVDPSQHQGPASNLLRKLSRETWTADFKTMKIDNSSKTVSFQIRRLCTETLPGNSVEAGTYGWYFLDKQQNWVEYGKVDSLGETNLVVDLTSDAIEKQFAKDSSTPMQFSNSQFSYTLDFVMMVQTNLKTQVAREVRRRPHKHLEEEEEESGHKQKQRDLPKNWDVMKNNERIKRVVLSSSSDEYKKVTQLLGNISGNVTKIERVQNRFHWQAFQNKIEELADIYGDASKVNVRQLFHGTGHNIVAHIMNENFDPKLHGQSAGQAYGQGTYFARDANMSYGYCKADSAGLKYMFVAKVAMGSLTTGNSSMARPPLNPNTGYPFESTGDNPTNPSIIVKYDKAEYFPEYILTLK